MRNPLATTRCYVNQARKAAGVKQPATKVALHQDIVVARPGFLLRSVKIGGTYYGRFQELVWPRAHHQYGHTAFPSQLWSAPHLF